MKLLRMRVVSGPGLYLHARRQWSGWVGPFALSEGKATCKSEGNLSQVKERPVSAKRRKLSATRYGLSEYLPSTAVAYLKTILTADLNDYRTSEMSV